MKLSLKLALRVVREVSGGLPDGVYFQPDGASVYFQPDGSSLYLQP